MGGPAKDESRNVIEGGLHAGAPTSPTEGPSLGGDRLTRNALYNLIGQGAPLLVAILAIPVLDAELGTAQYGILLIAWMLIGYFGLFDLGMGRALTQLVAERLGDDRIRNIPPLIWTALGLAGAVGVVGALLLAAAAPLVSRYVAADLSPAEQRDTVTALFILSSAVPFVVSTACLRGVLAARQRFDVINALRIPMGIFTFVGPLVVVPFVPTLSAVMIVLVAGRIAACGAHVYFTVREFPGLRTGLRLRKRLVVPLLKFGGWMTVSNIVSPLMVYLDRLIIGFVLTATAVAYYATPWEVVTKLLIIPSAISAVLFPSISFLHSRSEHQAARVFVTGLKFTALALLPGCLLVVAAAGVGLEFWLGTDYATHGTVPMQLLTLGVFLNGVASVPFALIQGRGRPDITAKLHLLELPLYLVLLFALITPFGLVGVAVAWVVRVGLDLGFLLVLSRPYAETMRSEYRKAVSASVLFAGAIFGMIFVADLVVAVTSGVVLIVAGGALTWRYLLSIDETAFLRRLAHRYVRWIPAV